MKIFKKHDTLIYTGKSNEDFDKGQEVILMEDLSKEVISGMKNTHEEILLSCMYFGGKCYGVGFSLFKLSELSKK